MPRSPLLVRDGDRPSDKASRNPRTMFACLIMDPALFRRTRSDIEAAFDAAVILNYTWFSHEGAMYLILKASARNSLSLSQWQKLRARVGAAHVEFRANTSKYVDIQQVYTEVYSVDPTI